MILPHRTTLIVIFSYGSTRAEVSWVRFFSSSTDKSSHMRINQCKSWVWLQAIKWSYKHISINNRKNTNAVSCKIQIDIYAYISFITTYWKTFQIIYQVFQRNTQPWNIIHLEGLLDPFLNNSSQQL